jgi:DNA-binding XRE family transcriptional regulator
VLGIFLSVASCGSPPYIMKMIKDAPLNRLQISRETGSIESAEPLDLGQRVRGLRKAKKWALEQAAQQAGQARFTLSKIENGQMSPTY